MKTVAEIILRLQHPDQLLIAPGSVFHNKRRLNADAEEYLIEESSIQPHHTYISLQLHLRAGTADRVQDITNAIRQHFAYKKKKSERQLAQTLRLGWRSLLIAIVFLGILASLTFIMVRLLPQGGVTIVLQEILIVLGWVALWRPADLLLYEWRSFKKEVNLFARLEKCEVDVIMEKE